MDELLEIGVRIRKFVIISIGTCYRSVCNHPFVVGMVLFLIFLYRSFPFAFSLLASASPVLICTAALLGTLLSFGHPNIPEIDKEEKTTDEIVSLKMGVSRDATVVERDESYSAERYTERRSDVIEKPIEEASSTENKINDVDKEDILVIKPLLAEENLRQIQFEERMIEETERKFCDSGFEKKSEIKEEKLSDREVVVNQYSRVERVVDENIELGNHKLAGDSFDSQWAENLDFPPASPFKQVEEKDDEASESGSDLAESSSPDASITDIMPMLDELHPLLDEDAPQPAHLSHDAASECSLKSSDGSNESDEDSEIQEDLGVGDEDDDDDDDEEEAQGDKENAIKSAITWTEDDEKNLMDLGTSELERNQRLESLIARRRARKNLRMMAEKNLIDLDGADLPIDIAPISTRRHNPFDLPYDSYDNMGLPPIPGSAPSILLPRRNPFDLPYDSSEEKPDLMGDSFQQEYMTFLPKESFFRRHESFNVGPSFFGFSKQERQDIQLRPYFIPERMASEGTSHSSFRRQSSELSDSKVSSVPETELMGSAGELKDKKLIEEDFSQETELISSIGDASEHIGHGNQSSEDVETVELGSQAEKRDVELNEIEINLGDVENQHEMESSLFETGSLANPVESNAKEIHLNTKAVKQKHSSRSSSSSFSEVSEKIFTEEEGEELSRLVARGGSLIKEPGISTQPSLEESDLDITSLSLDYTQNKEPVYDSSPSAVENNLSSSISSDLHVESLPPVMVKRTISFTERESEVSNEGSDTPCNEEVLEDSSQLHGVDVNELRSTEISEQDVMKIGISGVDKNPNGANASIVPHSVANNYLIDQKPSSGTSIEKDLMYQDHSYQHTEGQFPSLSFNADIHVANHQDEGEKVESPTSHYQLKSSEDQILAAQQEAQLSLNAEQVLHARPNTSSFESESKAAHLVNNEVAAEFELDHVHSLNSNANFHVSVHEEAHNKLVYQCVSEEKPMTEPEEVLLLLGKSGDISSSVKHDELKENSIIQATTEELSIANNLNISEIQYLDNKVSPNVSSPSSPDPTTIPTEVYETRAPSGLPDLKDNIIDEVKNDDQIRHSEHYNLSTGAPDSDVHVQNAIEDTDEIKEIDEGLLLELDKVGDFSVIADPLSVKTEVDLGESEIPHQGPIKVETESAMPVLEARSLEDIDTAFKQVSEKEIKKPIVVEPLDADVTHEETMDGSSEFVALLQWSNLTETKLELPVLEARSIEDVDLTFKQLPHGNVERHVLPGPVGESPNKEVYIDLAETPSQLHVVETRTPEDADTTLKHVSESNVENLVKLDSEDRSAKVEANKVGFSKDTGGIIKESGEQETSAGVAEKTDHEVESSDDVSSIISDVKREEGKFT